jgi:CHAT domain-containing protein
VLLFVIIAAAQENTPEALANRLEAASTDSERAAILSANPDRRADLLKIVTAHGAASFAKPDYDSALRSYRAALAIAVSTSDQAEVARTWRWIGACLYRKNDLNGALEIENKALELSTKIGDQQIVAETLQGLTAAYIALGRLDDAEQTARRAIMVNKEIGNKRRVAAMMVNLSTILGERGDQEAKAEILRQTIQESEQNGFKDILVPAVNNLGVLYYDQGEYERSLQYIRRAGELLAAQKPPDNHRLAMLHSNIAVMLARLGRDQEALQEYDTAAKWAVALGDEEMAVHIRFNRAALFRTTGKLNQALAELRAVSAHYETSPFRTDAIRSNGEYAQALLVSGDAQGAVQVAETALREAKAIGGPDLLWQSLHPLGEAYLSLGRRVEARASFLEAISAVESIKLSGGEDEKENFFHEKAIPYHGMVRLLIEEGNTFAALQYAERAKARLLLDVLRGGRAEIARAMTDAEKQRERDLSAVIAKLDSQLAREGGHASPELLDQRNEATLDLDEFHASLYQGHPELRVKRAEFAPLQMAEIGDLLHDADTALLEYTVTRDAVYLFAIARDGSGKPHVESYTLRDPSGIAAQIEHFRAQLAARDLQYKATAQSLYNRVLGPASVVLRRKKRLVIVPDGSLWSLPFQALLSPQGRHLIEQAAIFYVPSFTAAHAMLTLPRAQSRPDRVLLALGGPASTAGFTALPESVREVRQIGELYGTKAGTVMTGSQADKERWKAQAPEYRILHLATHGVLNSNNPLYSYLVMNRVAGTQEDSVLSAREILGMNLDADLTVLSACETARGKFRFGEGLIGMSWAFLVAGTPTTVVSQWKVDSASTSSLMVAFHRSLKASGTAPLSGRAEALRGAVLALLQTPEYRHPFYWAGFAMIGNGY